MLIIDDIVAAPFKGILWTFEKINQAAREEIDRQRAGIRTELRDLYTQLDAGQISEDDFDKNEKLLLDRLDELEKMTKPRSEPSPEQPEQQPQPHENAGEDHAG